MPTGVDEFHKKEKFKRNQISDYQPVGIYLKFILKEQKKVCFFVVIYKYEMNTYIVTKALESA